MIWLAIAVVALLVLVACDVRRINRRARTLHEADIRLAGRPAGSVGPIELAERRRA